MKKYPDYMPHVDDLLEIAEAKPEARDDLINMLDVAQYDAKLAEINEERPPARLLKQCRSQLNKTIELLERLEKHGAYFPCGITLSWPRHIEHEGRLSITSITAQEALRDIKGQIGEPKRGNPGDPIQLGIIFRAEEFFAQHAPRRPSAAPGNPFTRFCECFFEAVTGKEASLEYSIKTVLRVRKTNRRKSVA